MIQKITIRPTVALNCTIPLSGQYFDKNKGRNVYMLSNFKVIYREPIEKEGEMVWTNYFSSDNREFNFEWDDAVKSEAKDEKEKLRNIEEWVQAMMQHSGIESPGNKNIQGLPNFILIDKRVKDVDEFRANNDKSVLFNMLLNMEVTELMDVAYSAMINPAKDKLSTLQIFNKLADFNFGVLQQNAAKFLFEWKLPDATRKSVIRKAIMLDIITSHNGMFKVNNDPIGNDIDDLVVYFKTNAKMYEYLASEVAGKNIYPYDVNEPSKVIDILMGNDSRKEIKPRTMSEPAKADAKAERSFEERKAFDEMTAIRMEAKDLGIKGWQIPTISKEVLLKKIEDKKLENANLATV
jgi:hypothetical protein